MPRRAAPRESLDLDGLRILFDQHRLESGARVHARRKELGLSQEKIAKAVGVTIQTISKIERGDILPRDYLRAAISHVLACEIDDLWPYPGRLAIAQAAA
jgi:DNA-binding XRE family transcriptional regulator